MQDVQWPEPLIDTYLVLHEVMLHLANVVAGMRRVMNPLRIP